MKPRHALTSCVRDAKTMRFIARCKCGYESISCSDKHCAQLALVQHIRDEDEKVGA